MKCNSPTREILLHEIKTLEKVIDIKTIIIDLTKGKLDEAKDIMSKRDEDNEILSNELKNIKNENSKIES